MDFFKEIDIPANKWKINYLQGGLCNAVTNN